MKIKCLRIHHEPDADTYTIFDRYGKFKVTRTRPIRIENLPKVIYFGYCPIDTEDITLEFETPIDSRIIKAN